MNESHAAKLLAHSGVCTVKRCGECEIIHLHFGSSSLRFRPAAFVQLRETLLSALGQAAPETIRAAWPARPVSRPSH